LTDGENFKQGRKKSRFRQRAETFTAGNGKETTLGKAPTINVPRKNVVWEVDTVQPI